MKERTFFKVSALATLSICVALISMVPRNASAVKYMDLKAAIKHFMPAGSSPFKVKKSIPSNKLAAVRKQFDLKDDVDFKETLNPGPYSVYITKDAAGKVTSYIMILDQYWRTCYHKYAVGLDATGKIKEVVIVELSCPYAYPINKKSFLKQFKGKKAHGNKVPAKLHKDIDSVSGATASCDATAKVARRAMALFNVFFSNN